MTSRTPILRVLTGLVGALAAGLVWVPAPAHAATVTMNTSRTSAPPSVTVKFSGTATGAATGAPVALQRRLGSGTWSTIKTGAKVSASDTYALSTYVAVGSYSYRTRVGSSSFSPAKTVVGTYGRNVAVPAAGSPFTLSARLPTAWSRPVKAQVSTNGTSWTNRGTGSSSSGLASVRTYLTTSGYVRIVAPATSSLPTWVGPRGQVTIGTDPVIQQILNDTNAERISHGKSALVLKAGLNTVAVKWAYTMHKNSDPNNCPASFKHNPNFSAQYPAGWTRAAENIAAGQSYGNVVNSWLNSPPHHTNIDGDYTHIGIGYHFGTRCYQRYYVQNFAKY